MSQQQDFAGLASEGLAIIDAAEKKGATLRLMGGVAVRMHTRNNLALYERLDRVPGDLDFMGLSKQSRAVKESMESLGYGPNQQLNAFHGHKRQLWYSKTNHVDILFDMFEMCHVLDLKGRLDHDRPTISLADLFLQKIQIVEINEKDIKDIYIMLIEHELSEKEQHDKINLEYVAKLLGEDWGFWYTTNMNLGKAKGMLDNYPQLTREEKQFVSTKIDLISGKIADSPKSFKWKMRDRIGTKTKWYNTVEEVVR